MFKFWLSPMGDFLWAGKVVSILGSHLSSSGISRVLAIGNSSFSGAGKMLSADCPGFSLITGLYTHRMDTDPQTENIALPTGASLSPHYLWSQLHPLRYPFGFFHHLHPRPASGSGGSHISFCSQCLQWQSRKEKKERNMIKCQQGCTWTSIQPLQSLVCTLRIHSHPLMGQGQLITGHSCCQESLESYARITGTYCILEFQSCSSFHCCTEFVQIGPRIVAECAMWSWESQDL